MKKQSFPPSRKLTSILALLSDGAPLTQADLADRLDVTQRQIRRLVDQLCEGGIVVERRRIGHQRAYWLPPEHRLTDTPLGALTEQQALALSVAADAAQAVLRDTPLAEPLRAAFARILEAAGSALALDDVLHAHDRWYIEAIARTDLDAEVFAALLRGLTSQLAVRIDYAKPGHPPDTGRTVDPICLAVVGNAIVLTAWCRRKQALREFALPRITRAVLCDPATETRAYFDRPDDFDPDLYYARARFGVLDDGVGHHVRLCVEPQCAHYFEERDYHPTQRIRERRDDGALVVTFDTSGLEEMRSFAQSWGTGVTVLGPPELVARMKEDAEALATRYRSNPDTKLPT